MTAIDYAWAAGFLDGEGHFGAIQRAGQPRSLRLYVVATQTATRAPLDKLCRLFGGNICLREAGKAWQWGLAGAPPLRYALPLLIPHLVVKCREAEVLLAIAQLTPARGFRIAMGDLEKRTELSRRLVELRR